MPAELLEDAPALADRGGAVPPARPSGEGDGGGGAPTVFDPTRFGLMAFLGTVSMLFIGFTSALLLRRASADWRPLQPPTLLYFTTLALLLSSVCLEAARRRLRGWDLAGARALVELTGLLGLLFVVGQFLAWRSLSAQGIYLSTNPSSSFFYLLSGIHALHLLGGLAWLGVMVARARRLRLEPDGDGLGLLALYWHFLGVLWLYLLVVLFVI